MKNEPDNPILDIIIRAAKHQISSNLKHISTTKPFKLDIKINDEELNVTVHDIDHDGYINYDNENMDQTKGTFVKYDEAHWLILTTVGYKLSTKFEKPINKYKKP